MLEEMKAIKKIDKGYCLGTVQKNNIREYFIFEKLPLGKEERSEVVELLEYFRFLYKENYNIIYRKGGYTKEDYGTVSYVLQYVRERGLKWKEYVTYYFKTIVPSMKSSYKNFTPQITNLKSNSFLNDFEIYSKNVKKRQIKTTGKVDIDFSDNG
jgi:hypothetical protein